MKLKKALRLSILAIAIGLTGCIVLGCVTPSSLAPMIHELAADTNAVQISVTTVWGTINIGRNYRVLNP